MDKVHTKVNSGTSFDQTFVQSVLVTEPHDKELKLTKSWATNALLKYFYSKCSKKGKDDLTNYLKEIEESVSMAS